MEKVWLNSVEEITKALSEGNIVYDCMNNRKHKIVNNIMTESDCDKGEYVYINYGFGFEPNRYYIKKKDPIKMEVGKFYKNRTGEKVICMYKNKTELHLERPFQVYVVGCCGIFYNVTENGKTVSEEMDIVDYWKEENE